MNWNWLKQIEILGTERKKIRKQQVELKKEILKEKDRATVFYLMAEMQDLYDREQELTRQIREILERM